MVKTNLSQEGTNVLAQFMVDYSKLQETHPQVTIEQAFDCWNGCKRIDFTRLSSGDSVYDEYGNELIVDYVEFQTNIDCDESPYWEVKDTEDTFHSEGGLYLKAEAFTMHQK